MQARAILAGECSHILLVDAMHERDIGHAQLFELAPAREANDEADDEASTRVHIRQLCAHRMLLPRSCRKGACNT